MVNCISREPSPGGALTIYREYLNQYIHGGRSGNTFRWCPCDKSTVKCPHHVASSIKNKKGNNDRGSKRWLQENAGGLGMVYVRKDLGEGLKGRLSG